MIKKPNGHNKRAASPPAYNFVDARRVRQATTFANDDGEQDRRQTSCPSSAASPSSLLSRHYHLAAALNNVGALLHGAGQFDQALSHYTDAVNIRMEALQHASVHNYWGAAGFREELRASQQQQQQQQQQEPAATSRGNDKQQACSTNQKGWNTNLSDEVLSIDTSPKDSEQPIDNNRTVVDEKSAANGWWRASLEDECVAADVREQETCQKRRNFAQSRTESEKGALQQTATTPENEWENDVVDMETEANEDEEGCCSSSSDASKMKGGEATNAVDCESHVQETASSFVDEILAARLSTVKKDEERLRQQLHGASRNNQSLDLYRVFGSERGGHDASDVLPYLPPLYIPTNFDYETNNKQLSALCSGIESAVTLYNMGLVHRETGSYDKALRMFAMASSLLPKDTTLSAALLNSTALVHCLQGRTTEALNTLGDALYLEQHVLGKESTGDEATAQVLGENYEGIINLNECTGLTCSLLGRIHFSTGEYDKAMDYCQEALSYRRETMGDDNLTVASTLYNIGLIFHQRGDRDDALEHCQWFIQKAMCSTDADQSQIALALYTVGVIHAENDNVRQALIAFTQSRDIRRTLGAAPRHQIELSDALFQLGQLMQDQGKYSEAIDYYQEALQIERTVVGNDHEDVASILNKLGQIYDELGQLDDALSAYEEVLRVSRGLLGDWDEFVANQLTVIGNVYLRMGEMDDALANFADATRILDTLERDGLLDNGSSSFVTSSFHMLLGDFHPAAAAA